MDIVNKYSYQIQWSEEDEAYIAGCLEFPSLKAHGDTQLEALDELKDVVLFAVEDLAERSKTIPSPLKERKFKGNISLRLPPETHEQLYYLANEEDLSLNQFITTLIEKNMYSSSVEIVIRNMELMIKKLNDELSSTRQLNEELLSMLVSRLPLKNDYSSSQDINLRDNVRESESDLLAV